jgi:serine/threonine-protein kinase
LRTHADGGPLELLATPDSGLNERFYSWPHVLPGGKAALFTIGHGRGLDSIVIAAVRFDDRRIFRLGISGLDPKYVATGHLLFTLPGGTVMAAPFDPRRLDVTGPPVAVLDNVLVRQSGASQYTVSESGTLVYVSQGPPSRLVMTDRSGRARALLPDTSRTYGMVRFSPDGKRLVMQRGGFDATNLWIYEFASRALTQFTNDNRSFYPDWSADGRRLAWTDFRTRSIWWQSADANMPAELFLDSARGMNFSPAGRFFSAVSPEGRFIASLDAPQRRVPFRYAGTQGNGVSLSGFAISPDGKWAAYSAIPVDGRQVEIFVQALPGPGVDHRVSMEGGTEPMWGATSSELFFRNRGQLWSATLATSPTFAVVRRDSMFAMNAATSTGPTIFDVSPDGNSFVFAQFTGEENPPPVQVTNWFVELRARMKAAAR